MKYSLFLPFLIFVSLQGIAQSNQKLEVYIVDHFKDPSGKEMVRILVPGKPPDTYRAPIAEPTKSAVLLSNVPAFSWSFGCSPTAVAMAAGYYDHHDYSLMYTGPANGGLMPMNNSIWGSVTINGETRDLCPLSATRLGLDGRTSRGHVDDYWIHYGNNDPDPYIVNGWPQHIHGECTADFMGTNQSYFGSSDGSTGFAYYIDGSPTYDFVSSDPAFRDGCHGMRLFYESREYSVVQNYTQLIYGLGGNTLGFTFDQYKNEINNGRPVIIHISGHSMLGYGYDDASQTVYLHDTWDYNIHSMTWGGSYSGMEQWGVSCVELYPALAPPIADFTANPTSIPTGSSVSFRDLSMGTQNILNWTFEGGTPANSSQKNPVITYNNPGTYQVTLVVTNAYGSDTETKTAYITVTEPLYCAASANCDEYISGVQLGSINNSSACGTGGYTNYSYLSANLVIGQAYTINVTNGNPVWPEDQCAAWIDWNHDMDFDDAGEMLTASGSPGVGPYSVSFTVPAGSAIGTTGLRVRITYSGTIAACGGADWGETEDYSVNIFPNSSSKMLKAKVFLEGLYNTSTGLMNKAQDESGDHYTGTTADQVNIKLALATAPYSIVAQSGWISLNQDGNCVATFPSALNSSYYLIVNHRNSINTWSANPVSFSNSLITYNFCDAPSKAYGSNMVLKSGKYCIYGGDVNQDGIVDSGDMIPIDNLSSNFGTGYLEEDANGDGLIDSGDMILVDNNAAGFIGSAGP